MELPGQGPDGADGPGGMLHDGVNLLDAYLPPALSGERAAHRGRLNEQSTAKRLVAAALLTIVAIVAIALLLSVMIAFGAFVHETAR